MHRMQAYISCVEFMSPKIGRVRLPKKSKSSMNRPGAAPGTHQSMPPKRARGPDANADLERFTQAELAAELVKRHEIEISAAHLQSKSPSWCLDAGTQAVMQDPVTLSPCGHSIDRKTLQHLFSQDDGVSQTYKCPVPTCQRFIGNRPWDFPTSVALKHAIQGEQEARQGRFDEKLQKAYDAIKFVVDAAFDAKRHEIESRMQ